MGMAMWVSQSALLVSYTGLVPALLGHGLAAVGGLLCAPHPRSPPHCLSQGHLFPARPCLRPVKPACPPQAPQAPQSPRQNDKNEGGSQIRKSASSLWLRILGIMDSV